MDLRAEEMRVVIEDTILGFSSSPPVRATVSAVTVAMLVAATSSLFIFIDDSAFLPETDFEFTSTETGSPAFRVFSTVCVLVSPSTVVKVSM